MSESEHSASDHCWSQISPTGRLVSSFCRGRISSLFVEWDGDEPGIMEHALNLTHRQIHEEGCECK